MRCENLFVYEIILYTPYKLQSLLSEKDFKSLLDNLKEAEYDALIAEYDYMGQFGSDEEKKIAEAWFEAEAVKAANLLG